MIRKGSYILIFILFGCFLGQSAPEWDVQKVADIFEKSETIGTFVVHDTKTDYLLMFNEMRAHQAFYPASTFEITNSLIALKTKAVYDEDEVFYQYEGYSYFNMKEWENDASLRSGIKVSHVPAFQELARRIGLQNMREQLDVLDYGNREVGNNVENFWLEGPLKISAVQQVYFLTALAQGTLSYPEEVQEAVRDICLLEQGDSWVLYGKTGWATKEKDPGIGWFVGWVNKDGHIYSFSLNIDMTHGEQDLPKRVQLAKESLHALEII